MPVTQASTTLWSMLARPKVLVVGSGVVGMTAALCLAEAGCAVQVVAASPPELTTSAVAGALWGPYAVDDTRVVDWSLRTFTEVDKISAEPGSGVSTVRGYELSRIEMTPPPWLHKLDDLAVLPAAQIPDGYATGWTYSAPIFDMPLYLGYLTARLRELGVRTDILRKPLRSLSDVGDATVVVNCTGLGARELVPDPSVSPSWGVLVRVENPGIEPGFFSDYPEEIEPTYFISHSDHVILGGCMLPEPPDETRAADLARRIHQRCSDVEPKLARAEVQDTRAGLRPVRPRVRLERVTRDGTIIVHNYGHGGAGVTLSWGCARDVVAMLDRKI
jgi:D-amino-acid oxidase